MVTADRGLCGAYNSTVLRDAERAIRDDLEAGRDYSLITVGRKAESYFRYRDYTIDAAFTGFSDQPALRGRAPDRRRGHERVRRRARPTSSSSSTPRFVSAGVQVVVRSDAHAARTRRDRHRRR